MPMSDDSLRVTEAVRLRTRRALLAGLRARIASAGLQQAGLGALPDMISQAILTVVDNWQKQLPTISYETKTELARQAVKDVLAHLTSTDPATILVDSHTGAPATGETPRVDMGPDGSQPSNEVRVQ